MNFKYFLIGIVTLLVTAASGQKKPGNQPILFSIDAQPVSVDEFVFLYKKNHQGKKDEFTKEKIEEYLELFINFKLKVKEAESRGMHTSDAFIQELNSYKEELKKPFVAETSLIDRLTKEVYERMGQEVKASHILISVKPGAQPVDTVVAYNKIVEIRNRIIAGADFKKMAEEYSEDPSAKSNAGSLGYFSALQMVFPFEQAAYTLSINEVSNPVRTRFGYHLLKVEDKRPSRGEVEVSHILVRGSEDAAKKTIDEVYNKLQGGGDWNELCAQYSQDPGTKDNGGKLRPFGSGALASAPEFEEMAFSMQEPGAVSVPFKTSFGWHIIRLEKKIPLAPFSELAPSLKRRVATDDRVAISKSIETEKRKKKLNYQESKQLSEYLQSLADSSLVKGKWKMEGSTIGPSIELFSADDSKFRVGELADFIQKKQGPTSLNPLDYATQLFNQFVEEKLAEIEDRQLQRDNPEYRNLVNEYREGILLFSIMEKEIWNKASEDSLGQRKYFETNAANYTAGVRVEARMFATDNKEFLTSARERIQAGDSLKAEELKKFKAVSNFRAYEKGDHKTIDAISWTIGLHETEANGMYYLVEVSKLVAPGQKKFEEVRANVISDYQDYLEKNWIKELKNKYTVEVNAKGKKKALSALTTKEKS